MRFIKFLLPLLLVSAAILVGCGGNENSQSTDGTEVSAGATKPSGNQLFAENCAMCHQPDRDGVGPALKGSLARWNNDTDKLKKFIRNSQQFVESKDPYVLGLYEKWNHAVMPPFEMSDAQLDALMVHLGSLDQ